MNKTAVVDWGTVLKLLAGGAVTGAGLGAGTSFIRYLKSLQDQSNVDTSADDNVLYLDLPPRPEALPGRRKRASTGTYAIGGMAGILGTILAYNAVRNMYQRSRKKQLQQELDNAQNIYMGNLTSQAGLAKGASQFGPMTKGVGTLYLAAILAALGSGVVANKLLQKNFPPIKNPNLGRPRKIVVRTKSPEGGEDQETITPKGGVTPDSLEGLVRTNMSVPKSAHYDGFTADLVMAAANGRCDEIREGIASYGVDATMDLIKGARFDETSNLRKQLAVTWVSNDPLVSRAIEPLVAAEFYDRGPWCCKIASYLPEEDQNILMDLATSACHEVRAGVFKKIAAMAKGPVDFTKVSADAGMLESVLLANTLKSILGDQNQQSQPQPQQTQDHSGQMNTPGTQSNVPVSEDSPVLPDIELTDDEAKAFWDRYGGMIDNAVEKV